MGSMDRRPGRREDAEELASIGLAMGVGALLLGLLIAPLHGWLFPGSGEIHPFVAIGRGILLGLLLVADIAAGIAAMVLGAVSLRRERTDKGWSALGVGIAVLVFTLGFGAGIP